MNTWSRGVRTCDHKGDGVGDVALLYFKPISSLRNTLHLDVTNNRRIIQTLVLLAVFSWSKRLTFNILRCEANLNYGNGKQWTKELAA